MRAKIKKKSIKDLEHTLQDVMYPLIKARDEEFMGGKYCISCGKFVTEKRDWQAGHFGKAELCNLMIRYAEQNINGQCSACNHFKAGNTIAYERAMRRKWGDKVTDTIKDMHDRRLPMDFNSREFLEERIFYYRHLERLELPDDKKDKGLSIPD